MPNNRDRRPALKALTAVVAIVAVLVIALASNAPARPSPRSGRLAVGVEVLRFTAAGHRLTGTGVVTARLTSQGRTTTVRTSVAVTAAAGPNCKVLHLFLNQLNLQLLGLTAHLDKVVLDITGDPHGGVLGSLFCKLARAKIASAARASAARALTRGLRRHHRRVLAFSANLTPQITAAAASSTCQVLDLVVGPLNLQLLGLVVDLNQVHLSVIATRGQGALGDLFCQLADNAPTTTTTSTTTTSRTTTSTTT